MGFPWAVGSTAFSNLVFAFACLCVLCCTNIRQQRWCHITQSREGCLQRHASYPFPFIAYLPVAPLVLYNPPVAYIFCPHTTTRTGSVFVSSPQLFEQPPGLPRAPKYGLVLLPNPLQVRHPVAYTAIRIESHHHATLVPLCNPDHRQG